MTLYQSQKASNAETTRCPESFSGQTPKDGKIGKIGFQDGANDVGG